MFYFLIIYTTLLSVSMLMSETWIVGATRSDHHLKKKECVTVCGNVIVKPPFGIGKNCSKDDDFELTCNSSSSSSTDSKPILTKLNLELLDIVDINKFQSWGHIAVQPLAPSPKACVNNNTEKHISSRNDSEVRWSSVDLRGSPFFFDNARNSLVSFGCDGFATLYNETTGETITGCSSTCRPTGRVVDGCSGYHCCGIPFRAIGLIKRYVIGITMGGLLIDNETTKSCRSAFLIRTEVLRSQYKYYATTFNDEPVPFVINWYLNQDRPSSNTILGAIAIFSAIGLTGILLSFGCFCSCWLYSTRKRRREARLRTKYFKRRLEQTSSNREVVEKIKLFSVKEMKKSTDNFNGERILGRGGQGTVYKGMLDGGQIVAVKQSKTFDESQWEEFINELILLSQVNHRNIVKIVGCCLESNVPILVYEFISNGNLSQHIHNSSTSDYNSTLITWKMRLRIATEASCAIAYLHSSSATPIYHRDIKATNILLDDRYQAKVSDFGISKAISVDQTHLTTLVKGTFGYLDPEYFRSSHYSEKSDVYSFGVILIELLTGQAAIRKVSTTEEERSLVEYFISSMNQNAMDEVLDPIVLAESRKEEVIAVANLIRCCLHSRGALRPTMKEVAMELEMIRNKSNSMDTISVF